MEQSKGHHADAQIEYVLHRLKKNDPNIICSSGNKVTKICTNPQCLIALRCSDGKCKTCGKDIHRNCISLPLEQITQMINDRTQNGRQILIDIFRVEEEFIEKIRQKRKQFMDKFLIGKLKKDTQKSIKCIYTDKKFATMSGLQANVMCHQLQTQANVTLKDQKQKVQKYKTYLQSQMKKITDMRANFFLEDDWIDSNVMLMKGSKFEFMSWIKQALGNPKAMNLLYRASQSISSHQSLEQFHKRCDGVKDTFTILRTEAGRTVACYSHYRSIHNRRHQQEQITQKNLNKILLLDLDLYQKYKPNDKYRLIQCLSCCAATSTSEKKKQELIIWHNCSRSRNNSLYGQYNQRSNNQEAERIFCENTNKNKSMRVLEYQVFKVVYQ